MATQPKRLVGIDVLRAFAIISVLAMHLCATGLLRLPTNRLSGQIWRTALNGNDGVILFFAISGFVIARTVIERDGALSRIRIGAFYLRRVARIGPALALSIALGIFALLVMHRGSRAADFVVFGNANFGPLFWASIATFTFNLVRAGAALGEHGWGLHWGVLWSLSVEEQFYLFFPLVMWWVTTRSRLFAIFAALIATGVLTRLAIYAWAREVWMLPTPACVDVLAVGVAATMLPRASWSRKWALRGGVVGLLLLEAGFLLTAWAPAVWKGVAWTASPLGTAVGAVLVMLCCQNGEIFTHRIWAPFARVGRVSYGIYLFHPLVLYLLWPILHGMTLLPALALFLAASTLAAEISFALVEQPASRWIRGRWASRGAPAPRTVASLR